MGGRFPQKGLRSVSHMAEGPEILFSSEISKIEVLLRLFYAFIEQTCYERSILTTNESYIISNEYLK